MAVELSYCVVNTEQRQLLRYCLDSIARERAAVPFETEVIVLDNASRDGSAGTARAHGATTEVIALEQRRGKGENDSTLLRRARGRYVLLLNEDSELEPGATMALHEALDAAARGRRGGRHAGHPRRRAGALRLALPGAAVGAADGPLAAPPLRRAEPRQRRPRASTGCSRPRCWCAATPPRRSATSTPRSSSTPTRSTSASACATPAGRCSTCPSARAVGHDAPPTTSGAGSSSSPATATATCASTTGPPPRAPCAG